MKVNFEQSISENLISSKSAGFLSTALQCVMGSIFLGLMSQFSVTLPFTPVPITMQTFALFLLIMAQGQKKATYSVLLYLAQASVGLPVLNGGMANPLWMVSPTAGYLVGFLACTIIGGYLYERKSTPGFAWTMISLCSGQIALFSLGTIYLSTFVGADNALALGVVPFLVGALLKLLAASCAAKPIQFMVSLIK